MKGIKLLFIFPLLLLLASCTSPDDNFTAKNQYNQNVSVPKILKTNSSKIVILLNLEEKELSKAVVRNVERIYTEWKISNNTASVIIINVNPEKIAPKKLKDFLKGYSFSKDEVIALTGDSQESTKKFAKSRLRTYIGRDEKTGSLLHSTNIFIMNKKGELVGEFPGLQSIPYDQIIKLLNKLK